MFFEALVRGEAISRGLPVPEVRVAPRPRNSLANACLISGTGVVGPSGARDAKGLIEVNEGIRESMSTDEIRFAIRHELDHIRRHRLELDQGVALPRILQMRRQLVQPLNILGIFLVSMAPRRTAWADFARRYVPLVAKASDLVIRNCASMRVFEKRADHFAVRSSADAAAGQSAIVSLAVISNPAFANRRDEVLEALLKGKPDVLDEHLDPGQRHRRIGRWGDIAGARNVPTVSPGSAAKGRSLSPDAGIVH